MVRRRAAEVPAATAADLDRLRAASEGPIDTTEVPEARAFRRLTRDAGHLPPRRSPIREAIVGELGRLDMTRYQLWKRAHALCPTLSQAAVYEFLDGRRRIGLEYIEALMAATRLGLARIEAETPPLSSEARGSGRVAPKKATKPEAEAEESRARARRPRSKATDVGN